ncbi:MAG: dienelactone hydrolase family protein [Proteobacteria bacterium]|nr:dienelactone hydrolase family protein [Pseudomonadota bacterium]
MAKATALLAMAFLIVAAGATRSHAQGAPVRVTFPSADGKTTLVGYLSLPQHVTGRAPAVVMMHGRAGAYSSMANGVYDAATLSRRHKAWGELWADHGYIALMVDGFGPRGYPAGFPRFSYDSRPATLNEVTVRPLDAYGALTFLRARPDVDGAHVGLQGWSNGGSATLAAMADSPGPPGNMKGFTAAIALYPACGLKDAFKAGYRPYASVRVFMGLDDEEVSPKRCDKLVETSREAGGDIAIRFYDGAGHNFDDPSRKHQRIEANAEATGKVIAQALRFFAKQLGGRAE